MNNKILHIYITLNILSIDVAIGAMCSALFLGHVLDIDRSNISVVVLGIASWSVYTADHLLDVNRLIKNGVGCNTPRHAFHQKHFKLLKLIWLLISISIVPLLFMIPKQVFFWGVVLSVMIIIYLLWNSVLSFGKEFIITLGYFGGVLLPLDITMDVMLDNSYVLICFLIIVFLNVIVFSSFDAISDKLENRNSFFRMIGAKKANYLYMALFGLQIGLTFLKASTAQLPVMMVLLVMTTIIIGISFFRNSIGELNSRLIGEAIFLFPGFYWIFTNHIF